MAKLDLDTEARGKIEADLTEAVKQYIGQRLILSDRIIRLAVKAGLGIRRRKYKDREEFDRIVRGHKVFMEFCDTIGLKI